MLERNENFDDILRKLEIEGDVMRATGELNKSHLTPLSKAMARSGVSAL